MRQLSTLLLSLLLCATCLAQPDSRPGPYQATLAKINALLVGGAATVKEIEFTVDGSALASSSKTQVYADGDAGNLTAGVPAGKAIKIAVAGTEVARFGGSGIDLKSVAGGYVAAYINGQDYLGIGYSNASMGDQRFALGRFGIASFSALYPGIACDANNIIHNVASGFFHDFKFANVLKYRLSSTLQEAPSLSLGGTVGSSTDGGIGSLALTNRIQFAGAGTADSTKSLIWADAANGNLFANVPTGKYHQWLVNGAPLFSLGAVGGITTAGAWGLGAFGATTLDATKPGFYCDANNIIYNAGSAYSHFFRINNVSSASIDTNGLNVLKNLTFAGAGSSSSSLSMMWADASAGNLFCNVPTGKYEQHRVNGVGLLSLGRASSTQDNSYFSIGGYGSNGTTTGSLGGILGGPFSNLHNVPSGNTHRFMFNDVEKYRFAAALAEFDRLSLGGTIGSSTDPGAGGLALNGKFYISTTQTPASAGATGTVGQICWDSSYVYICTATNTWKRAAIATW